MFIPKKLKLKKILRSASFLKKSLFSYRRHILLLTILGFFSGILEGVGINALIPVFSIALKQGGVEGDLITQFLKKFFNFSGLHFNLPYLLVFILSLFVIRSLVLILFYYIKIKISADYEENTRNDLLKKTFRATWPHLLKRKGGQLQGLIINHVQYSSNLLLNISGAIMSFSVLLVYALVAANISLMVTVSVLCLGLFSLFLFKPLFRRTRKAGRESAQSVEDVSNYVGENITGIKTIKYMGVGNQITGVGKTFFKRLNVLKVRVYMYKNLTPLALQIISLFFICALFAFSYKSSSFNFGAMVAIVYLIQRIFNYIQQLQQALHNINENIPYLQSVQKYSQEMEENEEQNGNGGNFEFKNNFEFRDVHFSYNGEKDVLKNLNFEVKRGETLGIIGPSGTGKTTLVDLVLRLLVPGKGKILLDNKNIEDISMKEWRKNIGYVSQDIFLINDTIANNIKFYNDNLSQEEIEEAAKKANIYNFVKDLPNGFSTVIGDRGVMLSAGQRQRLVIARILADKPKILVLDEATSALDNESEKQIKEVIDNLRGEMTVLIIAHRLSTVLGADRLLVLEQGQVIEQGEPQKLLADSDSYFSKVFNL